MGAFQYGIQAGTANQEQINALKQQRSDEILQSKLNPLVQNRDLIKAKLPKLLGPNGEKTHDYDLAMNELTQNEASIRELLHPANNPGALAKYGHLLTDKLKITNPAVRGQKETAQKAKNLEQDRRTAEGIAAGADEAPGVTATREAAIQNQQDMEKFRTKLKQLHELFPQASTEEQKRWSDELAANITGVKVTPEKYFTNLMTTKDKDGNEHYYRVPMAPDQPPEEVDFNGQLLQPKSPKKMSAIEEERESYRQSHNIPSGQQLNWTQEADFLRNLYLAKNPLALAHLRISEAGLGIREREAAFRDYMAAEKALTPLERVMNTTADADGFVKDPSGPGDVALTLAFFDAIKTTGVRFTKQEQDFIIRSRGFMDGVQAKFDGGFQGTVFSPDQRRLIADIVKKAGSTAQQQMGGIIGAANTFVPNVGQQLNKQQPGAPPAPAAGGFDWNSAPEHK